MEKVAWQKNASLLALKSKKALRNFLHRAFGGDERIRTAVAAFAELSLATRPRHRFGNANIRVFRIISNIRK